MKAVSGRRFFVETIVTEGWDGFSLAVPRSYQAGPQSTGLIPPLFGPVIRTTKDRKEGVGGV